MTEENLEEALTDRDEREMAAIQGELASVLSELAARHRLDALEVGYAAARAVSGYVRRGAKPTEYVSWLEEVGGAFAEQAGSLYEVLLKDFRRRLN